MPVSVVIVTAGVKNYLKPCLDSLLKQACQPGEIIVVDNSLKPELAQEIHKLYPAVKIYSSSENLFYSSSLNKGLSLARGEFILCLNDDVILDKDFIQQARRGFLVNDRIGLVSGKILRANAKIIDSTGLFLSAWRTAKERGYGRQDCGQFEAPEFIFGVNGAVAFYRKKMLEAIKDQYGYFDKRFKMFYEDLDVSWRANKKGWQAYYVPTAIAYHVRGGSFRPDTGVDKPIARRYLNGQLHYELIKNRYLVILKNEDFLSFLLHLVPVLAYDLLVCSYLLIFQLGCLMKKFLIAGKTKEVNEKCVDGLF
jgi:GT2 family glycosyltransferase